MFDIEEELKKLPASPGVYIMHDEKDAIIYVGKAISLKNRVRQYFQSSRNKTAKIEKMVSHIARFEYIITDSEMEALVLECNLIKEHRPKYNTMLVDDKTYPYIKVTVGEEYPRVLFTRMAKKDKSRYFGPYTSAQAVKDTIELLRKMYKIRTCNKSIKEGQVNDRPCLYYHMKQCDAPCNHYISKEEYGENIKRVLEFLNGNYSETLKSLREKMQKASEEMNFEEAIVYRDLIESVKAIAQKQKITDSNNLENRDILALATDGEDGIMQVFFIRDGKLIGREHFHMNIPVGESNAKTIESFVKQFYAGTPFIPKELMLQEEIEDMEILEQWLSTKRGQKVHIKVPKKGAKERMVELAKKNAALVLAQDKERIKREEGRTIGAMHEIANLLGLENINRIEAFDISNTSGFASVGSMIVYEKGKPKNSDYRKFRIKSVEGPDDYASMEEVLTRRFLHGMEEKKELEAKNLGEELGGFTKFPDLIMMDGGKGQVHIAQKVLGKLKLAIPVCGMVKDDNHRTRGLYYNDVELPIDRHSEGFKLITRIQDEAHRFAIEYHRSLRSKNQVHSILDEIDGIGEKRRKALLRRFKSVEHIKEATIEELALTETMNQKAAETVYAFFHKEKV
ncbi:MAG: excinuclease ABC subunit UvrC [Lachnospiraceae bacterium]|nr:excinuclease ABC subunit UvrC [Lachnospiraceae bacterium]